MASQVALFFFNAFRYRTSIPLLHSSRSQVSRNDTKTRSVITEVVIDGVVSPSSILVEDVRLLAFTTAERYLLAAATDSDLTVHSLKPFLDDPSSQCPYHRLLSVPFSGILDMKCTGDGEGLLLSDTRCHISCAAITMDAPETPSTSIGGSLEILWTIKTTIPQSIIAAGHTSTDPFAATGIGCPIAIYDADHLLQELPGTIDVTECAWCPIRNVHQASTESSLFVVDPHGRLMIWTVASDAGGTYLGSTKLQSTASIETSMTFKMAIIAEPVEGIIPGSMHATWVHVDSDFDPRLSWMMATYITDINGHLKKHGCLYVIRGLPVRLEGTAIHTEDVPSFLHCSVEMHGTVGSASTIQAVLLTSRSIPELLMIESSIQGTSSMTTSALCPIDFSSAHQTLNISMDMVHEDSIVGFASPVLQLIIHPVHDCVGVLTEDGSLTIWDLWPVQKLCDIEGDAVHLGRRIYAAAWMHLEHAADLVGHLLILGDHGVVLHRLISETIQGNHRVIHQHLISHIYNQLMYPQSITCITGTNAQCLTFLVAGRSIDPEIDDESGTDAFILLSIHNRPGHDLRITQSTETAFIDGPPPGITVIDTVQHQSGVIVVGTTEGMLAFYRLTSEVPYQLQWSHTAVTSTVGDYPLFVSCLSTCAHASYIACVTSFDAHQNEDKIHVLQSESMRGLDYKIEDSFLSPCGNVAQITWIQTASPFPMLVVGYQAGQVDVLVRAHQGLWNAVGRYQSSLQVTTVTTTRRGLPIVGAGRHMLFLSMDAHCFKDDALDDNSVMYAAMHVGGALPNYHPASLMTLLQLGHVRSFEGAMREMLEYVKKWERMPENERWMDAHSSTIIGPSCLLPEMFAEAFVPDTSGIKIGEIVEAVPFSQEHPVKASEDTSVVLSTPQPAHEEKAVNDSFMTGQFDVSQFNRFTEETPIAPTFEASGLLDMSAFGMDVDASLSESDEGPPQDTQPALSQETTHLTVDISNGHPEPQQLQETEACVLFQWNDDMGYPIQRDRSSEAAFDMEYARKILMRSEPSMPLDCLLKLSSSNLDLLTDLLSLYDQWSNDHTSLLDLPGKKFLSAVKLMPLSKKSQPKRASSMNNATDFNREDTVSPFLHLQSYPLMISRESVASDSSSSVDDRLTEGYVSWPKSVGIGSGIEAIHLLWALESKDPNATLTACLDATSSEATEKLGRYSWDRLKLLGIGFWIRDRATAISIADEIAKDQFKRKNDPHDCALLYIALGKRNLLSRLFRSNGHARVADLLNKDFTQEHHKQTAAKNAFVLLGQHRHALAAAFFLVGGHIEDAIGVCAKELHDPQLALFLTRLLDIDCTKIMNDIITKELLPEAMDADDRVAQGMLLWLIDDKAEALKAITTVKALKSELTIADRAVSKILLLQFVLEQARCYLSNRSVKKKFIHGIPMVMCRTIPLWILDQIKNVAAHCAHVLETCGLPLMALTALLCCRSLEAQFPQSQMDVNYDQWSSRLVSSIMMMHLPSPQVTSYPSSMAVMELMSRQLMHVILQ